MQRDHIHQINIILVDVKEQIKQARREGDPYCTRMEHVDAVLYGAMLGALFALGWNITADEERVIQDFISFLIFNWHGPEGKEKG